MNYNYYRNGGTNDIDDELLVWFGPKFALFWSGSRVPSCSPLQFYKEPLIFSFGNLSDNKIIAKDLVFPTTDHRKTECIQIIGGGI